MNQNDPATVFESRGLVDELKKRLAERMLNGEMDHHLGGEEERKPAIIVKCPREPRHTAGGIMTNLRERVTSSVVPVPTPISVKAIANLIGLGTAPISIRRIMDFLAPPIVRSSGPILALTVKSSGALAVHPSGLYVFVGHAHENGLVGNNYALSFAIGVTDNEGHALSVPPHEKKLSGTVDPGGSRDDDFQVSGFDQRIRDRWHEVSTAKVQFSLHAATDPLQVVELVGETLIAALAVAGLTFLAVKVIPLIPTPQISIVLDPDTGAPFVNFTWHFP